MKQHETPPPAPESLARPEEKLAALETNLDRFAWAFDALAHDHWAAEPFGPTGASAMGEFRGRSLIEVLCYLRDEEAWRVGRRAMLLFQEESPGFERLTFEMAEMASPEPYAEARFAMAFSELFKNRMAWLKLARGELATLERRSGTLPPEEGGHRIGFAQHLDWTLRRDLALRDLVLEMKRALREG